MRMQLFTRSKLYPTISNLAYLPPIAAGLISEELVLATLIAFIFIVSTLYHLAKGPGPDHWKAKTKRNRLQQWLLMADTGLSLVIALYLTYLLLTHKDLNMFWISLAILLPLFLFYKLYKRHYEFAHTLWHLGVASVLVLVLIGV